MENPDSNAPAPWFSKGLRFECRRCGGCCRGEPGYVWVSPAEAIEIAGFLGETIDSFSSSHLRLVGNRTSLIEKPNGDCVFWDSAIGCRVYPLRPVQCRTFPFWAGNLDSPAAWEAASKRCPGIGHGKVFSVRDIVKRRERRW